MNEPEIKILLPNRLKRGDMTERKKVETRIVDEIVVLREQLFKLHRSKAESQNEILALREAYDYKDDNG